MFLEHQKEWDEAFIEAHPEISIEIINNDWAQHNQLVPTWAAAGELPDLLYVHGSRALPWSKEGMLGSLDSYLESDEEFDVDGIFPEALRLYTIDGSVWAIPYDHGPIILGYNKDLFDQVVWAANQLAIGYYGWRDGSLTQLAFNDDTVVRLAPTLNAGTVALMYFFNQAYPDLERWQSILDPESGFVRLHNDMFGDPQARAASTEPLLPPDLTQPALSLPFLRGQDWSHTGGPHGAWERQGAQAALDFAPGSVEPGCVRSEMWVVAAAPGVIARIGKGVVVLDLDGDGNEHTGWSLLYLHLSDINNLKVGQWVDADTLLGHPSCEGGISTGTHVHVARKYNGEWLAADGPVPFNLGGWVAHAGDQPYLGELTRGDETITACSCSAYYTHIVRTDDDP